MAFRSIQLLRIIRNTNLLCPLQVCRNVMSTSTTFNQETNQKVKQFRTEDNLTYFEDPDTFGTLSRQAMSHADELQDEGDIKEEKYTNEQPLQSQKLTTRQYADIIKQFVKHKRLKEAIDVLEVRMLKEDRVKPENYIFNILIGACADVGYTKKAFKLYNDMKRRALKPTGDTYTCLFHACANSPWPLDGLKNAKNLRELMIEKGIEPNLTNYNSMIKAFGRCGDLPTAFKIVDEMMSKDIKIRVHTFNHLLQACISNKENGLRHALVVWRKMLKMREKPNIYSFNLMLKCVKDCNLGNKEDIEELIGFIQGQIALENSKKNQIFKITSIHPTLEAHRDTSIYLPQFPKEAGTDLSDITNNTESEEQNKNNVNTNTETSKDVAVIENNVTIKLVDSIKVKKPDRVVPNLLSKSLQLQNVMSLQAVQSVQDKFAVIGGQEDFLKEMETYLVKPDIKIFSQMIPLLETTRQAENKLLDTMKSLGINADIDFYNMLIKQRCMRKDYDGAFDVKEMIETENKSRKKKHPWKKNLKLTPNIMTFGVLAMACKTKESADKLLSDINEKQIKVNIEILGSLLRQGIATSKFGYVLHIMNIAKEEKLPISPKFLKHLEYFYEKCTSIIQQDENGKQKCTEVFMKAFEKYSYAYKSWLKEVNIEQALTPEHPWKQFREEYPETVQRTNVKIEQPKKFYKRNRKFVPYVASVK